MRVVTFREGETVRVATHDRATSAQFEGDGSERALVVRNAFYVELARYDAAHVIKCIEPKDKADAARRASAPETPMMQALRTAADERETLRAALQEEAQAHQATQAELATLRGLLAVAQAETQRIAIERDQYRAQVIRVREALRDE